MATIDDRDIIDQIIAGKYRDDRPRQIVEYTNAWGNTTWGVSFKGEDIDRYMRPTHYVRNPRVIWKAK